MKMHPTKLHDLAAAILRKRLGDRISEVYLSAWCQVHGDVDRPHRTTDYRLGVILEKHGRKLNIGTDGCDLASSFVRTPEKCLKLFEDFLVPQVLDFMGIMQTPEFDPIAMGA
jgi:hypothetical protein